MNFWERLKWDVRRLYHQGRKVVLQRKIGDRWERGEGFRRREYPDYHTYVEHQKTKFSAFRSKSILGHDRRFFAALSKRLGELPYEFRGSSVLCLGARQGSEVRAFVERGAFAVGIDLNPGPDNPHVLVGDFHDLQFADDSVDWIYTNSLDHAFELDRVLAEVRRVLRPGGRFLVEANVDAEDGAALAGPYESMVWDDARLLVSRICDLGFQVEGRRPIEVPWTGEQYVLRCTEGFREGTEHVHGDRDP